MATYPANGSNIDTWDAALKTWLTDTVFADDGSFKNTKLGDIGALTPTDGNIIVGNDTTWVAESGGTARTSLGLGTGDSPDFAGLSVLGEAGVSQEASAGKVCDVTELTGGIATAQSQITPAADGTYTFDATAGNVDSITITNGRITAITTA